jgi:hypothetical protein
VASVATRRRRCSRRAPRSEPIRLLRGRRRWRPFDPEGLQRPFGILSGGEVSEWLMVPLSKSGVRKHRGFESRPLRQHSSRWTGREYPAGPNVSGERSPSGLWRRTGNAVRGNPSRVRIPPSPPPRRFPGRRTGSEPEPCYPSGAVLGGELAVPCSLQSAPAGPNPLSRSPFSDAARRCDVEDRVPRSGEPRTVSGPEGSSTKRPSSGAAERPGPSRSSRWARAMDDRRRVHGIPASVAFDWRRS